MQLVDRAHLSKRENCESLSVIFALYNRYRRSVDVIKRARRGSGRKVVKKGIVGPRLSSYLSSRFGEKFRKKAETFESYPHPWSSAMFRVIKLGGRPPLEFRY